MPRTRTTVLARCHSRATSLYGFRMCSARSTPGSVSNMSGESLRSSPIAPISVRSVPRETWTRRPSAWIRDSTAAIALSPASGCMTTIMAMLLRVAQTHKKTRAAFGAARIVESLSATAGSLRSRLPLWIECPEIESKRVGTRCWRNGSDGMRLHETSLATKIPACNRPAQFPSPALSGTLSPHAGRGIQRNRAMRAGEKSTSRTAQLLEWALTPHTRATEPARAARGGAPGRAGRSQGAKRASARTGGLPTRKGNTQVVGPMRQRRASLQLPRGRRSAARSLPR